MLYSLFPISDFYIVFSTLIFNFLIPLCIYGSLAILAQFCMQHFSTQWHNNLKSMGQKDLHRKCTQMRFISLMPEGFSVPHHRDASTSQDTTGSPKLVAAGK